jgi:hypothetical protein
MLMWQLQNRLILHHLKIDHWAYNGRVMVTWHYEDFNMWNHLMLLNQLQNLR